MPSDEPYILKLDDSLWACPMHWQAFIKEYNPDGETASEMRKVLKEEYGGEIDSEVHYVTFESKAHYVLFCLRYTGIKVGY